MILLLFIRFCSCALYIQPMTSAQALVFSTVKIAQYLNGQCTPIDPIGNPTACEKYCASYYAYVPNVTYNNLALFNSTSKLCQSRPICPNGWTIKYDVNKNICYDTLTNLQVDSLSAAYNKNQYTINTSFDCWNGTITTVRGMLTCVCNFGYYSTYLTSLTTGAFRRCDGYVPIVAYFPAYMQIYYQEDIDNIFPSNGDSRYWGKALIYYMKYIKYRIVTFFCPYEVQIVLIIIPQQFDLRTIDIIAIIWFTIFFVLVSLCSLYEKWKHTLTAEEMMINIQINQE